MSFEKMNAEKVLEVVEALRVIGKSSYKMDDVYKELSIFDWWVNTLSQTRLKQMSDFLHKAIELGYRGYVCFKVGVAGCANGMWAHKNESSNGYSPDGEVLYRSFTTDYTSWDAQLADGSWVSSHLKEEREDVYRNLPFKVVKKFVTEQ